MTPQGGWFALKPGVVLGVTRPPSSGLLPFFWGEGSPTKIDYSKSGTLIVSSLLEDLGDFGPRRTVWKQMAFPQGSLTANDQRSVGMSCIHNGLGVAQ